MWALFSVLFFFWGHSAFAIRLEDFVPIHVSKPDDEVMEVQDEEIVCIVELEAAADPFDLKTKKWIPVQMGVGEHGARQLSALMSSQAKSNWVGRNVRLRLTNMVELRSDAAMRTQQFTRTLEGRVESITPAPQEKTRGAARPEVFLKQLVLAVQGSNKMHYPVPVSSIESIEVSGHQISLHEFFAQMQSPNHLRVAVDAGTVTRLVGQSVAMLVWLPPFGEQRVVEGQIVEVQEGTAVLQLSDGTQALAPIKDIRALLWHRVGSAAR